MTVYHTRPGVLLTQVCGEYMLVATREARKHCTYVQQINGSAAVLWERLEQGATVADLRKALEEKYRMPGRDIGPDILNLLRIMEEAGYLLTEEVPDGGTGKEESAHA